MGRSPCCAKEGLNRGAWSAREDKILTNYIKTHGEGKWRDLPQRAGLKRCGKSCRLRWLNYLRPDIKRGNISMEEEDIIIKLHKLLGNRWSLIAGRLPGRTDNEIKNYWNTNLSKRVQGKKTQNSAKQQLDKVKEKGGMNNPGATGEAHRVIRTKAVRCTRVIIPQLLLNDDEMVKENLVPIWDNGSPPSSAQQDDDDSSRLLMDFDISDLLISDFLPSDNFHQGNENDNGVDGRDYYCKSMSTYSNAPLSAHEASLLDDSMDETMRENWRASEHLDQPNEAMELKALASFFQF